MVLLGTIAEMVSGQDSRMFEYKMELFGSSQPVSVSIQADWARDSYSST